MEKKISVIIPVYNVEKYIRECLDSVLEQSLKDIEVVCVNDGSTDGSRSVLSEYEAGDKRIIVLDKENGGLSSARNSGIDIAQGKYVLFLDSDDLLASEEALSILYDKAEKEVLDQLYFDAEVFFENEEVKTQNSNYIEYYKRKKNYPDVMTGKELFSELQTNWDFKPNACMQLLRRSFLIDNKLTFCEGILHEDEVFTLECATLAQRAAYIDAAYLKRRIRGNSIMTSAQKAGSIYGYYYGIEQLLEFAQRYLSVHDTTFTDLYLQRVLVLMESSARLFAKVSETDKEEILDGVEKDRQFTFAADMKAWQKNISLKEKLDSVRYEKKAVQDEKKVIQDEKKQIQKKLEKEQKKNSAARDEIQTLSEKLQQERKTADSVIKELREEKKKLENLKQSTSYKVGRAVTWVPRKVKRKVKNCREPKKDGRSVWLIGTPEFGNLGDHMISEVEREILRTVYPEKNIHEITMNEYWEKKDYLKNTVQKNDLLVFHGGGNVGNLWPKSEYIRRDAFGIWKEQKKIIMPQSICFTDDEEGRKELEETRRSYAVKNLLLCCRDAASYQFAEEKLPCGCIYVPDTVLFHKPEPHSSVRKEGAVLCLRSDKEKAVTEQDKEKIISALRKKYTRITELDTVGEKKTRETRREGLKEFFDQLRRAEIVVTDRLHGMIFCALIGVPCIALDNSYHKVSGAYDWLKPLEYIHYIRDVSELDKWIEYDWKDSYQYPYEKYREKFKALVKKLS